MDYTYRERHGEAVYWFKGGMLPSDFFRRNVVWTSRRTPSPFAYDTSSVSTT
jgi:hypothetical protein